MKLFFEWDFMLTKETLFTGLKCFFLKNLKDLKFFLVTFRESLEVFLGVVFSDFWDTGV